MSVDRSVCCFIGLEKLGRPSTAYSCALSRSDTMKFYVWQEADLDISQQTRDTNNLFHAACVPPDTTHILPVALSDAMDNEGILPDDNVKWFTP
jgi:hypothetical protein